MANKVQIKRGNKANLPILSDGEFGLCQDTKELFIGNNGTNINLTDKNSNDHFYRQAIMNGNFDIWQRGTSFIIDKDKYTYTADRYYLYHTGFLAPVISVQREDISSIQGAKYGLKISANGAGSSYTADSELRISQIIEDGTRLLAGKTITISFKIYSQIQDKKIGVRIAQIFDNTTLSGIRFYTKEFILNTGWNDCKCSFTLEGLAGKTLKDGMNLNVSIYFAWGSNKFNGESAQETLRGSGNYSITQLQLNAGETDLPFDPKSFDEEFRDCLRYYEKSYNYDIAPGANTNNGLTAIVSPINLPYSQGNSIYMPTYYKVEKRRTPTITCYSKSGVIGKITNLSTGVDRPLGGIDTFTKGFYNVAIGNGTAGSDISIGHAVGCHWTADAEI